MSMYIDEPGRPGFCANCDEPKAVHGYKGYPYCPDSLSPPEQPEPLTAAQWAAHTEKLHKAATIAGTTPDVIQAILDGAKPEPCALADILPERES